MLIGAGLDARLQLSFPDLRAVAREAARLGFESLWTPAGGVPDAFHVCGAWLEDTGLRAGTSVVPAARLWTPQALAAQAATLGLLSGGRFVLGIGSGGYGPSFWQSLGAPNRPISVMRDYVTVLHGLLRGATVTHDGAAFRLSGATLGLTDAPTVPVYIATLGEHMFRLAGECADGALLNWATPARIAEGRALVAEGAARTNRDPSAVTMSMYVRVCIDDDVDAARRAFGEQVLGYALGRPGVPDTLGYRGQFGSMGFDEVLTELEARRDAGASMPDLVDATPDDLLLAAGYYGTADGAPAAYARASEGLDETVVRVILARPGPEAVVATLEALTPEKIRAAQV
jgi:alkanesulfonate monooxygenase SsuD/methylene tetrahydromethanopterin reductase-like flavin-dependent oxidoreductase (luciferase family)